MRTMAVVHQSESTKAPCPQCGAQDVERTPMPGETTDGKEKVDSTCSGCGLNRGDSTRSTNKHRVRNHRSSTPRVRQHRSTQRPRMIIASSVSMTSGRHGGHPGCGFRITQRGPVRGRAPH